MNYKKLYKELKNKLKQHIKIEQREYQITKDPIFKEWLSIKKWLIWEMEILEIKEKEKNENQKEI